MNPFHNLWGMICLCVLSFLVSSLTYANTDKFDLDTLIKGGGYPSAIEQLDGLLDSLDYSRDVELWTVTLLRGARLRALQSEHKIALDYLQAKSWPKNSLATIILKLGTTSEIEHYLNQKSWALVPQSGRNESLAKSNASEFQQQLIKLNKYYQSAFDTSKSNVFTLKQASVYLTESEYPERVRGYLVDLVASRWMEFLSDDLYWSPKHQKQFSSISLDSLLDLQQAKHLLSSEQHPLVTIKHISAVLFEWHDQAGRKEAAFEVSRFYTQLLNRRFSTTEDTVVLSRYLTEQVKQLGSQYPWWAMGQYQLALFKQQMPYKNALLEAHDLAVQASIAHPDSMGAKLSKILLRELEYQEFSVSGLRSSGLGQASLNINYRNVYRLYFKAWRVNDPLPPSLGEGELRVVIDELLKQPVEFEWITELPFRSDLHHHDTQVAPQITEHGQWLVMASPQAEFADVPTKLQLLNIHLSHYVASVSYHDGEFRVAVYDGLRGHALPNIVVELLKVNPKSSDIMATAKTNVHGIATLARRKDAAHYQIRLRNGNDNSIIEIPGLLPLHDEHRWSFQPAKAVVLTDKSTYKLDDKIFWSMLVKASGTVGKQEPHALIDKNGWIKLYNPNNQLVAEQQLKTDRVGLASGEFLVNSKVTESEQGTWRIESSWHGAKLIEIKEDITANLSLDKLPEALTAGQRLSVSGTASAQADGSDNDTISWQLRRVAYLPNGNLQSLVEISQGVAEINKQRFELSTILSVDESASLLRYRFELQLDYQRKGKSLKTISKTLRLTNDNHYLSILSDKAFYEVEQGAHLIFSKTNSQWQGVSGESQWFLYSLTAPNKAGKQTDAAAPKWLLGALQQNGSITHFSNGEADLHLKSLAAGVYRLRIINKEYVGSKAKERSTAELDFIVVESGNENSKLQAGSVLLAQKAEAHVGDTLKLLAGSGVDEQWVRLSILKQGKLIASHMLSPGVHLLEFPITQSHQGGLALNLEWVERNQIQNKDIFVAVPWDSKQLQLTVNQAETDVVKDSWTLTAIRSDGKALANSESRVLVYYSEVVDGSYTEERVDLSDLYQQFRPSMIHLDNNGASYPYYFRESRRIAPTPLADLKHAEIRYSNQNNDEYLGKNNSFDMLPMMLVNTESALGDVRLSASSKAMTNTPSFSRTSQKTIKAPEQSLQQAVLNADGTLVLTIPESLQGKKVHARILVVSSDLETGQLSVILR
jgi:5-hydroxyisourate hydrolase-like protein (transthyretin family)